MKTTTITLRISEEEKAQICRIAKEKDISVSQLVRELCRAQLKED